jgi:hypothetical protein
VHNGRVAKSGEEWSHELVRRIGAAMKAARGDRRSAKWLSDRTAELGYRISPTVIAKLDSGHRGNVLSVAEFLVLAVALDIPPALLLFPGFPDGRVELLPGYDAWPPAAVQWLCGEKPLPVQIHADDTIGEVNPPNTGTELIGAYTRLNYAEAWLRKAQFDQQFGAKATTPESLAESENELVQRQEAVAAVKNEISRLRVLLWGTSADLPVTTIAIT